MKSVALTHHETSLIAPHVFENLQPHLRLEMGALENAQSLNYDTPYASINVPYDKALRQQVSALATQKKALRPTCLIIVGIGGSNLGTAAIHYALHGVRHNEHANNLKVYFADTVDPAGTHELLTILEQHLQAGGSVLVNIVSKSGGTIETIANAALLVERLRTAYGDQTAQHVVVTTDEGSPLWNLAHQEGFATLAIPKLVGGRYSVFSAVSLFPLVLLGVNIEALHEGARSALQDCLNEDIMQNPAASRAAIIFEHYRLDAHIHDMFVFYPNLFHVGLWYRQLMGESIGKTHDREGNEICVGITPTTSIGSTDLHSVGQLYLGGPYNRITTFVTVTTHTATITVPSTSISSLVPPIKNVQFSNIMEAVLGGAQRAYQQGNRPFMTLTIPGMTPYHLGYLLQLHMMEMMYLGYLLNVNPFDQPQVEFYKQETKKILTQGSSQ